MSRFSRLVLSLCVAAPAFAAPNLVWAEPRATVVGVMDRALREELQVASGDSKTLPSSPADARRRARDAAEDVSALLRSEGYYDSEAVGELGPADPPKAVVRVTAGERFRLKAGAIAWVGTPPSAAAVRQAEQAARLTPGGPGRAADILAAEARAVTALHKAGYADAEASPREVIVDHDDHTVQPNFRIAAHDVVHFGGVKLSGRTRTGAAFIRGLATWRAGDVYDPGKLAKFQQRLIDAGVYDGVTVSLAPPPPTSTAATRRAVLVGLDDRKTRTLDVGAGYSTTQGSGIDGRLTLYDRLGRADSLIFTGRLYDIQQKLDAELDLPDFGRPDQILKVGGGFLRDRTAAYDDLGGGVRLNVERHFTKTTYISLGGAFDYATTKEKTAVNLTATPVGETLHLFITTGLAGFALDRSNDPLNPIRGWRLDAHVEPTYIAGDRSIEYLKALAQASGYVPIGADAATVIAARIRAGTIWGGSIPDVPADRRFFAGGGGSVRGYGYQEVGPRLSDNTPQGGLSLAEASFEVRRHVIGKWSTVAFADVGAVGTGPTPSFRDYGLGVGLGARYDLGFAPLRIDLATPLRRRAGDSPIQVYISLGQSF